MDNLSQPVTLIIIFSVLLLLIAIGIAVLMFIYQKRRLQYLKEKDRMQAQFQQELLRTQLEIQEQTFRTISQEIHDNIGQMLSLAKLNLNTVDLHKETQAVEKISDAKALVSKAIQDLRDLSKSLNTDTIAASGLLNAIEAELNLLQKTGALQTAFHVSGTPVRLDAQKELILFRMVQEALHNVIKHAQAMNVRVNAVFEYGHLKLLITDDGCGFVQNTSLVYGSGLRNMQNRSKLIGADWQIESAAGQGTTIRIIVPIRH
jgi:two-component system, NarL family, sensor kinase